MYRIIGRGFETGNGTGRKEKPEKEPVAEMEKPENASVGKRKR